MTTEMLFLTTERCSIRAEVTGWGQEAICKYARYKPIGYTPRPDISYSPSTVFEALADGWDLIGQPTEDEDGEWNWWLKKGS
jgi:hypothetical protein